jgi:hypothetical protein
MLAGEKVQAAFSSRKEGTLRKNAQEPGQLSDDTVSYTYVVRIAREVENK